VIQCFRSRQGYRNWYPELAKKLIERRTRRKRALLLVLTWGDHPFDLHADANNRRLDAFDDVGKTNRRKNTCCVYFSRNGNTTLAADLCRA
jgi:hypothetical protein